MPVKELYNYAITIAIAIFAWISNNAYKGYKTEIKEMSDQITDKGNFFQKELNKHDRQFTELKGEIRLDFEKLENKIDMQSVQMENLVKDVVNRIDRLKIHKKNNSQSIVNTLKDLGAGELLKNKDFLAEIIKSIDNSNEN